MPIIGGENIGTAYVRVVADGKDFDLNDLFDDTEGEAGKSGRRSSAAYREAWIEEWKSRPSKSAIDDSIRNVLVKGDTAKAIINSAEWQRFRAGFDKEFDDIGRRAADNLEKELREGLDVSSLNDRILDMRRDLVRAEKQLDAEAYAQKKNEFRKYLDHIAALQENDLRNRKQDADDLKRLKIANNEIIASYKRVRQEADLMRAGERRSHVSRIDLIHDLDTVAASMRKAGLMTHAMEFETRKQRDALLRLSPTMSLYANRVRKVADITGDAFGKGSRNDFLNFTGSVARNFVGLGESVFRVAGYFGGLRNRMRAADSAGGALKVLFGDIAKGAGRAVGGLAGLFGVIGPLTSVMSGLGGMVLALASSLGGAILGAASALGSTLVLGLGGALAAVAGAIIPVGAGIVGLILGMKNLTGEAGKAANGIKTAFNRVGVSLGEGLMFDRTAVDENHDHVVHSFVDVLHRLRGMLSDLRPIAVEVGRGMADALDIFTERIGGADGAWNKFIDAIKGTNGELGFFAVQARTGGRIIGEAFGGLLGVFRALIPTIREFTGWLRGVAIDFNNFANSARGQNELRQFFSDASESASQLGGFLLAVRGLLAEIFDQANADGNGLFASMTEGLQGWTETLNKNPDIMRGWMDSMHAFGDFTASVRDLLLELVSAGKDVGDSLFASLADQINGWVSAIRDNPNILQSWYDSAGDFARVLGNILEGLGRVFGALDNEFSRGATEFVFTALADVIDALATVLEGITSIFGDASDAVQGFAGQAAAAAFILPRLTGAMETSRIAGFITNLRSAETRMTALAGAAKTAAGVAGLLVLVDGFKRASDEGASFTSVMEGVAGGAALGSMGGVIGALIGGAAGGGLVALKGAFKETAREAAISSAAMSRITGLADAKVDADALRASLDGVVDAYGRTTRAAIEASFTGADGKLDADIAGLRNLGISMDTIVSATLGRRDAINEVNAALSGSAGKEVAAASAAKAAYEAADQAAHDTIERTGKLSDAQVENLNRLDEARKKANDAADVATAKASAAQDVFNERVKRTSGEVQAQVGQMKALASQLGITVGQYKDFPRKVRTDFESRGLPSTTDGVLRLIDRYKTLQSFKNIKALVSATGVALTEKQVKDLKKQYDLTPKQVKTLISLGGALASKQSIEGLINSAKNLDKQRPKPKIDVDKAAADARLRILNSDLNIIGHVVKTPKITVDASQAASGISGIRSQLDALRDKNITITETHRRINIGGAQNTATGGTFYGAQIRRIAEDGPEAVVPLARNLSQVDPSVRWLSAIAQGKMALGTGLAAPHKTISADNWTIVTPTADPVAVGKEVFDRLAAQGY